MLSFESDKAKKYFTEQLNNLQEYVCSSKSKDEQAYRALHEKTLSGLYMSLNIQLHLKKYRIYFSHLYSS